jgi:uncharacterized 2Fe-2S/4Fe-4S cluster protein (DUF4445 family)
MKKSSRVEFLPFRTSGAFVRGTNLLDAIKKAGLPLKSACGGKGTCGECLVRIAGGEAKTRTSAALPKEVRELGYALACQTEIEDDLTVELPRFEEQSIRTEVGSRFFEEHRDRISGVFEVNPVVRKIQVSVPPATLSDNSSDLRRLQRKIQKEAGVRFARAELGVLKRLAAAVREKEGSVTAVLAKSGAGWTLVDLSPLPPRRRSAVWLATSARPRSSARSSTSRTAGFWARPPGSTSSCAAART